MPSIGGENYAEQDGGTVGDGIYGSYSEAYGEASATTTGTIVGAEGYAENDGGTTTTLSGGEFQAWQESDGADSVIGVSGFAENDANTATKMAAGDFETYAVGYVTNLYGLYATTTSNGPLVVTNEYGIYAAADGLATNSWGGYFTNLGTSGVNYGLYASTSSASGYAGYFDGKVNVNGVLTVTSCVGCSAGATVSLSSLTSATTTNSIDNNNWAQVWKWGTLSTQTALTLSTSSLTTGTLLNLDRQFHRAAAPVRSPAVSTSQTGAGYGINVSSATTGTGYGIYSALTTTSNIGAAIYATNATTTNGYGVYANLTGANNIGAAGYFANATGSTGSAVHAELTGSSNSGSAGFSPEQSHRPEAAMA